MLSANQPLGRLTLSAKEVCQVAPWQINAVCQVAPWQIDQVFNEKKCAADKTYQTKCAAGRIF